MEKLIPELRFPEFDNNSEKRYKKHPFTDIFLFSTGKNIKQSEASSEFEIPCVRYGELYHMYSEVISNVINKTNLDKSELLFSKGDEILLPSAGEDPLDIGSASALTIKGVAIGRTINILKPLKENVYSQIYVSYYINQKLRKQISTLAKGVSISNVYNSDLKTLQITLPSLDEQQKIASFLCLVDNKISKLKKKKDLLEEYKKGLMQKLFSQEIRFKDDNGDEFPEWEVKKLGEVLKSLPTKQYQIKSTEIKIVGKYKVVDQGQNLIAGYSNSEKNLYINKPIIVFGDHTTSLKFIDFDFIIGADGTKLLKNNNDENLKYLFYNLTYNNVSQQGYKRHFTILSEVNLQVPFLPEQTKIADFLSTIDTKIAFCEKEIDQMEVWKKGLLQKMFV
jgi:type I restriction enzyme, S subunit